MVFHEITQSRDRPRRRNPRGIDYGLVDAAETRRILDRLYGYEVSPVLWRRVNRGLSAGRVQSPSIRLIVERERERIAFVAAGYWDIELLDRRPSRRSPPRSSRVDGTQGRHGQGLRRRRPRQRKDVVVLDETRARALADGLETPTFTVRSVEEKPYRSSPEGAVHDLDAAAGGRPQAAPERRRR